MYQVELINIQCRKDSNYTVASNLIPNRKTDQIWTIFNISFQTPYEFTISVKLKQGPLDNFQYLLYTEEIL